VAELRWVSIPELRAAIAADPRSYAPWLNGVTERLADHLDADADADADTDTEADTDDAPERSGGR
jgi:isopentenyl-diphosphate delta-isomerase